MNKPNKNLKLTKTNYWINLKRKAKNVKDQKEQAEVNMELMNCIGILDGRIDSLIDSFVQTANVLDSMTSHLEDITSSITDVILPHLKGIESVIGREKVREFLTNFVKESKKEVKNQGDEESKITK